MSIWQIIKRASRGGGHRWRLVVWLETCSSRKSTLQPTLAKRRYRQQWPRYAPLRSTQGRGREYIHTRSEQGTIALESTMVVKGISMF